MDDRPEEEALEQMRQRSRPGTRWAVYQCQLLGDPRSGHLQFMIVGVDCTYREAPKVYPANVPAHWSYLLVGYVDLETGLVVREEKETNAIPDRP